MNESNHTMYAPAPAYYPSSVKPRLNALAVVALVTGLLGGMILPVALGHIALARIAKTGERGHAAAVIGLILGYIQIAMAVILFWTGLFDS